MNKSFQKILIPCLIMALLLAVFPVSAFAVETASHTHDFEVTTDIRYSKVDDWGHVKQEVHTHTCACGVQYLEHHNQDYEEHVARGPGTFAYSFVTLEGATIEYYRYTCRKCGSTYEQPVS